MRTNSMAIQPFPSIRDLESALLADEREDRDLGWDAESSRRDFGGGPER